MSSTSRYFGLYLEEARELYAEGTAALEQQDVDAFLRVAHTLKGMSGTMGYSAMADAFHELEEVSRHGKLPPPTSGVWPAVGLALDRAQATQSDAGLIAFAAATAGTEAPSNEAEVPGWWRIGLDLEEPMPRARVIQWLATLRRAGVTRFDPDRAALETLETPTQLRFYAENDDVVALAHALRRTVDVTPDAADAQPATPTVTAPESAPESAEPRAPTAVASTVLRVDLKQLDGLFAEVGELHSQLRILSKLSYGSADWERTMRNVQASATRGVQRVSSLRLSSLELLMREFERAALGAAEGEGKPVHVLREGGGLKVARETIERLRPLIPHVARNAVAHGIEDAETRAARGKEATGTIRLRARPYGNAVRLTIADDGGGIDTDALIRKARERGLDVGTDPLELLFTPGFSTREQADNLAGRGVGLDAVREAVHSVGGTVRAAHTPGNGFELVLDVPVPLSLQPVVEVRVDDVPIGLIDEGWQETTEPSVPWARLGAAAPAGDVVLAGERAAVRVHGFRHLGHIYVHPLRPPFDAIDGAIGFYLDSGGVPRLIFEPRLEAA